MADFNRPIDAVAIDGDTFRTRLGQRAARLQGVNTPERPHAFAGNYSPGQPGADAARKALQQVLDERDVRMLDQGTDATGARGLVSLQDSEYGDVSAELIASGLGLPTGFSTEAQQNAFYNSMIRDWKGTHRPEWQAFIQEARDERQRTARDRLARMFGQAAMGDYGPARESTISAAVNRGTDQLQGSLYGFANAMGAVLGWERLAEWGEEGMLDNLIEAAHHPARVASYEDIDSLADAGTYALEALFEFAPQLALDVVTALGTGGSAVAIKYGLAGIGKQALRKIGPDAVGKAPEIAQTFAQATKAGAAAGMYPQMAGESRMEQYQAGVMEEDGSAPLALVTGAANTALEYTALAKILGGALKGAKPGDIDAFRKLLGDVKDVKSLKDVLRRTVAGAGEGMAVESITELAQTLLNQLQTGALAGDIRINPTELIDATLKGGIVGGTTGGTASAASGVYNLGENIRIADRANTPADISTDEAIPILTDRVDSLPDTAPELPGDLEAQAQANGTVILSASEPDESIQRVVDALKRHHGEAQVVALDNGMKIATADAEVATQLDPAMTAADVGRMFYGHAKEDLDPTTARTAFADGEGGNRLREVVDDATVARRGEVDVSQLQGHQAPRRITPAARTSRAPAPLQQQLAEAGAARAKQDAAARPQPEVAPESLFQAGTRKLRPVGELMAAWRSGRLDLAELNRALTEAGIDPQRVLNQTPAQLDRDRTELAMITALVNDPAKAKALLGSERPQSRTQLRVALKRALQGLDEAQLEDLAARNNLPLRGPGQLRRASDRPKLESAIRERIDAGLRGDKALFDITPVAAAFPNARAATAEQAGGVGRLRDMLKHRFEPEILRQTLRDMDEASLVRAAETLGVSTKGLLREQTGRGSDVAAVMRELHQRWQPAQGQAPTPAVREEVPSREVTSYDEAVLELADIKEAADADLAALLAITESLGVVVDADRVREAYANQVARELGPLLEVAARGPEPEEDTTSDTAMGPALEAALAEERLAEQRKRIEAARNAILAGDADPGAALRNLIEAWALARGLSLQPPQTQADLLSRELDNLLADHPNDPAEALVAYFRELDVLGQIPLPRAETSPDDITPPPGAQRRDFEEASDLVFVNYVRRATVQDVARSMDGFTPAHAPRLEKLSDTQGRVVVDIYYGAALDTSGLEGEAQNDQFDWIEGPDRPIRRIAFAGMLNALGEMTQSAERTQLLQGQNLLTVTRTQLGQTQEVQIDAVALARFSRGEAPPRTAAEALVNLYDNLARMQEGAPNIRDRDDRYRDSYGVPQVPDSLVIFLDPFTGQAITVGEARNRMERQQRAQDQTLEAMAERDRLHERLDTVETAIRDKLFAKLKEARAIRHAATRARSEQAWAEVFEGIFGSRDDAELDTVPQRLIDQWRKADSQLRDAHKGRIEKTLVDLPDGEVTRLSELINQRFYLLRQIGELSRIIEPDSLPAELTTRDDLETADWVDEQRDTVDEVSKREREELEHRYGTPPSAYQRRAPTDNARNSEVGLVDESGASVDVYRDEFGVVHSVANYLDDDGTPADVAEPYQGDEVVDVTEPRRPKMDPEVLRAQIDEYLARGGKIQSYANFSEFSPLIVKPRFTRGIQTGVRQHPGPAPAQAVMTSLGVEAAQRQHFNSLRTLARRLLGEIGVRPSVPMLLIPSTPEGLRALISHLEQHNLMPPQSRELSRALLDLGGRPGYLNLGSAVVISMDPFKPGQHKGEWALTFAHELGHLIYDQSWHLADGETRAALQAAFQTQAEAYADRGEYAFKEWYADQFASATIRHLGDNHQGLGRTLSDQEASDRHFNSLLNHLRQFWRSVRKALSGRWVLTQTFETFAERLYRGEVPLAHRFERNGFETLHFGPGHATRMSPQAVWAAAKRISSGKTPKRLLAPVRMVISRIKDVHPELAAMLFQQAQTAGRKDGGVSYEQKRWALANMWRANLHKVYAQIGGRHPGRQRAAVEQAFRELRAGQDTAGARQLRKFIDQLLADAQSQGWRSHQPRENFLPEAFDARAVELQRGRLEELVREALPQWEDTEIHAEVDRLIEGGGLSEFALAPGQPVSTHAGVNRLIEVIGGERLRAEGFLLDNPMAVLDHFIEGLSKRTAWEHVFGADLEQGEIDNDPTLASERQRAIELGLIAPNIYYSPNAKLLAALKEIARDHGSDEAARTRHLIQGALGHHNLPPDHFWRQSQEWLIGLTNIMILGLSGVGSIPELAFSQVRAQLDLGSLLGLRGDDGRRVSLKEARQFAHDIGIVLVSGADQIRRESIGEGYQSRAVNWMNEQFFRLNGQNLITRISRQLSTAVAMRYLLSAARDGDHTGLARLHLDAGVVQVWDRLGRPAWSPEQSPEVQAISRRVGEAVSQFVNESSLYPSKFQATSWGNNPYLKLAWHLKQFLYTYGDTILGGVWRSMKERHAAAVRNGFGHGAGVVYASAPLLIATATVLPLAFLSLELRDWIRGRESETNLGALWARAGGFGPLEVVLNMRQAMEWDRSLYGALIPAVGQLETWLGPLADGELSGRELEAARNRLTNALGPYQPAWRGLFE